MEKCLGKLGCELCSCAFPEGQFDADKYLSNKNDLKTLYWVLHYSRLEKTDETRRLCRISECVKCGKQHCESVENFDSKTESGFLDDVYRSLFNDACCNKYELVSSRSMAKFKEAFINLFETKDKLSVTDWLECPSKLNKPNGGKENE